MRYLNGRVVSQEGRFFQVETDGPPHLAHLDLVRSEMASAQVGDAVVLNYYSTPSQGHWYVASVVRNISPGVPV